MYKCEMLRIFLVSMKIIQSPFCFFYTDLFIYLFIYVLFNNNVSSPAYVCRGVI
jgi:hypothetical protein